MKSKKEEHDTIKRGVNNSSIEKSKVNEKEIAMDFATEVYKKFRDVVKAIAMFGSAMRHDQTDKSDIDIIIIIDDCTVNWDDELIAWYREELSKIIIANKSPKQLHVNTVTLTAFWEEMRAGEPLIINVLRYGETLIDVGGFFDPLRVLLAKGKIRPTPEAIFTTMQRAGQHLGKANNDILNSIEGFYWAMVDASHAALMALKVVPPSPEQLPELLTDTLVNHKLLDKEYVNWYVEVRNRAKSILYGDITHIEGKDLEQLQKKSIDFVLKLNEITKELIKNEKIITYNLKD